MPVMLQAGTLRLIFQRVSLLSADFSVPQYLVIQTDSRLMFSMSYEASASPVAWITRL